MSLAVQVKDKHESSSTHKESNLSANKKEQNDQPLELTGQQKQSQENQGEIKQESQRNPNHEEAHSKQDIPLTIKGDPKGEQLPSNQAKTEQAKPAEPQISNEESRQERKSSGVSISQVHPDKHQIVKQDSSSDVSAKIATPSSTSTPSVSSPVAPATPVPLTKVSSSQPSTTLMSPPIAHNNPPSTLPPMPKTIIGQMFPHQQQTSTAGALIKKNATSASPGIVVSSTTGRPLATLPQQPLLQQPPPQTVPLQLISQSTEKKMTIVSQPASKSNLSTAVGAASVTTILTSNPKRTASPSSLIGHQVQTIRQITQNQPSTMTITSIAEQQTQQHIVQHHPAPLVTAAAEGRVRMIQVPLSQVPQLPQSPIRQSALVQQQTIQRRGIVTTTSTTPMRLPQSPVRQHQLPQVPVGPHRLIAHHPGAALVNNAGNVVASTRQVVVAANSSNLGPEHQSGGVGGNPRHLAMLPQSPTHLPPSRQIQNSHISLLPSTPMPFSNLLPQPPQANNTATTTTKVIPSYMLATARPVLQQLPRQPSPTVQAIQGSKQLNNKRIRKGSGTINELEGNSELDQHAFGRIPGAHIQIGSPSASRGGSHGSRSSSGSRGRGAGGGRQVWQCPALQDHNYASKPPPTPPPSPTAVAAIQQRVDGSVPYVSQETVILERVPGSSPPSAAVSLLPQPVVMDPSGVPALATLSPQPGLTPKLPPSQSNNIVAANAPSTPLQPRVQQSNIPSTKKAVQPISREQQNNYSIEEAGVGPMAPLEEKQKNSSANLNKENRESDDDDLDGDDRNDRDSLAGEETETAPEGDPEEDDSITRCICDFLHDDGYMICCDNCSVWQHVVCMGLDRNNIPDEYLCEICKPRPVDRKRAKSLQSRRRTEIFNNSSSDENIGSRLMIGGGGKNRQKPKSKKSSANEKGMGNKKNNTTGVGVNKKKLMKKQHSEPGIKKRANNNKEDNRMIKKRKRKSTEVSKQENSNAKKILKRSLSSNVRRSVDDDLSPDISDDDIVSNSSSSMSESTIDPSQKLRAWIDQYEEAVTNHYSPELRSRLATETKNAGITSDLRPSVIGGTVKCNVSLKGNGVKILTASTNVSANTPIIECKGRLMLASQFKAANPSFKKSASLEGFPYVFYYRLSDNLDICVDGKTYGNDARFCRRSSDFNADLRHVIDKGSLHVFIVAVKPISKNQEILLPSLKHDDGGSSGPLPSINADLKEIKKSNGILSNDELPLKKAKTKKDRKSTLGANRVKKSKPNRSNSTSKAVSTKPLKIEEDEESAGSEKDANGPQSPLNDSGNRHPPGSPNKSKTSPGKLGLPDNSGLIVGVNTINYDASSSVRNKTKSREEIKMEMIMKAIEQMEKAEQRKREQGDHHGDQQTGQSGTRRRKSMTVGGGNRFHQNSSSQHGGSNDGQLDASSADESKAEMKDQTYSSSKKNPRKKSKKGSIPGTPKRRRSRVLSGGSSLSAGISENEGTSESAPNTGNCNNSNGPFRFPKTKKSMMSDWLQETDSVDAGPDPDDDVSGSYLKGSRSPPGIATHLLRTTPHSPVKSVCSAKKRWLRQAISEDHTEDAISGSNSHGIVNGGSPSDTSDYVTPLKKRRLAEYQDEKEENEEETTVKEEEDEESPKNENESPAPNSLKKKLLHNLVIEAVLDKAMEDMLGGTSNASKSKSSSTEMEKASSDLASDKENFKENKIEVEEIKEEERQPDEGPVEEKLELKEEETMIKTNEIKEEEKVAAEDKAQVMQKQERNREKNTTVHDTSESLIKTPEPSSVFKSFFKSSVSLEELEAQIEATKQQRVATAAASSATSSLTISSSLTELASPEPTPKMEVELAPSKKTVEKTEEVIPTKKEEDVSSKEIRKQNQYKEEEDDKKENTATNETHLENNQRSKIENLIQEEAPKPKEKRKVSLADYKRRRKQITPPLPSAKDSSVPSASETPSLTVPPPSTTTGDGPGTPTMDEQTSTVSMLPTLNTLPLFEKLEKLEQEQMEKKERAQNVLKNSPIPEPKREDLTERLKKEFGLTVDEEENNAQAETVEAKPAASGDATPEMDSSAPPPPPIANVVAAIPPGQKEAINAITTPVVQPPPQAPPPVPSLHRFTPTQYPSYPSNYPLPPYPRPSPVALRGGVVPPYPGTTVPPVPRGRDHHYHHSSSTGHSSTSVSSSGRSNNEHRPRDPPRDARRDRDYRYDHRDHHHHHHRDRDRDYRDRDFRERGGRDSSSSRSRHYHHSSSSSRSGYY